MNSTLKMLQTKGLCFVDEPLSVHSTIGIGGKAKIFVMPETLEQFVEIVSFAEDEGIKHKIVGNMSNVLFSDAGYNGIIVCTSRIGENIAIWNNIVTCGAGTKLSKLVAFAKEHNLSGLEWACGIPGTVGGAIVQNAGAFGSDISSVTCKVLAYENRKLISISAENCGFSYRNSRFKTEKSAILDASFTLKPASEKEITEKLQLFLAKRVLLQPKGKSLGSVFKNTSEYSAGWLIEQVGLKGKTCGGAKISEKHANFIINEHDATQKDVLHLIDEAKEKVYSAFGIWLETEIEILSEE